MQVAVVTAENPAEPRKRVAVVQCLWRQAGRYNPGRTFQQSRQAGRHLQAETAAERNPGEKRRQKRERNAGIHETQQAGECRQAGSNGRNCSSRYNGERRQNGTQQVAETAGNGRQAAGSNGRQFRPRQEPMPGHGRQQNGVPGGRPILPAGGR